MKITVAQQTWEVYKVPSHDPALYVDGVECAGAAWLNQLKLYISDEITGDRALRTIRHEVCHAFIFSTQVHHPEGWDEEAVCDFMAIYGDSIMKLSHEIYTALFEADANFLDEGGVPDVLPH